ncbi:MAG TPA: hypothetical protein VMZ69_05350, partial [Saprospiraceae bacterium]|nr:hypothetical protein [Saprospiraceae bacterium]
MKLLDEFGQPLIRQQWDTILQQGKLPHAILLYGEPGSGILPGALSLAYDILCASPKNNKACKECPPCNRTQKWIHPDLHFLLPLAGSKSLTTEYLDPWREALSTNHWLNVFQWTQFCDVEGKQVDIHKEDIQHTVSDLCLQSYEGGNKVLIIWMAQFLTKEGNRLLKMIEEPPDQTYFILVTNQREHILPTIRSRCMQCFFPPIDETEMVSLLTNIHQIEKTAAERIARQSGNDMNKAMALAQNSMLNFKDELTTWFRIMLAKKGNEMSAWASKMGGQDKEEQKQFALYAMAGVREILKEFDGADRPGTGREMIKYMHENFDHEVWYTVINE